MYVAYYNQYINGKYFTPGYYVCSRNIYLYWSYAELYKEKKKQYTDIQGVFPSF